MCQYSAILREMSKAAEAVGVAIGDFWTITLRQATSTVAEQAGVIQALAGVGALEGEIIPAALGAIRLVPATAGDALPGDLLERLRRLDSRAVQVLTLRQVAAGVIADKVSHHTAVVAPFKQRAKVAKALIWYG
ncbi:MAG: hypothetical protein DCC55_38395 [Chloroflexi bacterium]|nr:MAG: hypothetical protein DCC55_38395 [Chloroflexota bacterium]